ncbi:hypothetical protein D3C73_1169160 [compost metagenome]
MRMNLCLKSGKLGDPFLLLLVFHLGQQMLDPLHHVLDPFAQDTDFIIVRLYELNIQMTLFDTVDLPGQPGHGSGDKLGQHPGQKRYCNNHGSRHQQVYIFDIIDLLINFCLGINHCQPPVVNRDGLVEYDDPHTGPARHFQSAGSLCLRH